MGGIYYARSNDGPREGWQTLRQHSLSTAELCRGFSEPFGSGDWGYNLGLLHDIGKASADFLRALEIPAGDAVRIVNHSSAGAILACLHLNRKNMPLGIALAYAILGHHAGIPDYFSNDTGNASLMVRMDADRGLLDALPADLVAEYRRKMIPLNRLPSFVKRDNMHLWIRMLFSCLIDADRLDAERFTNPGLADMRDPLRFSSVAELRIMLDAYMAAEYASSVGNVNDFRSVVLKACGAAATVRPGVFYLIAPGGMGKTLAAVKFGLDHCVAHGKRRLIIVVPYTAIIEQHADTLSRIFGRHNVIEHHTNFDSRLETVGSLLASENWDAPIIVTTDVQFFESLYSHHPGRCRKLHNIVNSVVILDEPQNIPVNLLSPCVDAINQLTRDYGVSAVISTATPPAFLKTPPGCAVLDEPHEIVKDAATIYEQTRRVKIEFPADLNAPVSWTDVANELSKCRQVLCVVNSRRAAFDLCSIMPEDTVHLSRLMAGAHVSKTISEMHDSLDDGRGIRAVSTQLIESGTDFDFNADVVREMSGLSSILQLGGRCNREGTAQSGRLRVFVSPSPVPPGMIQKGIFATRQILRETDPDKLFLPETCVRYYELLYHAANDLGSGILRDLRPSGTNVLDIHFRTVGHSFKFINEDNVDVIVRWGDGERLISKIRNGEIDRKLLRELQRCSVSIPRSVAEPMLADGRLVETDTVPSFVIQGTLRYDEKTGLDIYSKKCDFPVDSTNELCHDAGMTTNKQVEV